ncbi:hypothetical protein TWF679_009332 [Orbilia oligospora]|uniref:Ankyrin n=1 Tax=Orbilia oligospora TaxID=2813651 RepID=A0A8H8V2W1_ORBOL|nr:hypothetical protein TWF679_009332 [Orbilia oligospora]
MKNLMKLRPILNQHRSALLLFYQKMFRVTSRSAHRSFRNSLVGRQDWSGNETSQNMNFLRYAAEGWLEHALAYEHLEGESLPSLRIFLEKHHTQKLKGLVSLHELKFRHHIRPISPQDTYQATLFMIMQLGLTELLTYFLEQPYSEPLLEDIGTGSAAVESAVETMDSKTLRILLYHYPWKKIREHHGYNSLTFWQSLHTNLSCEGHQKGAKCEFLEIFLQHRSMLAFDREELINKCFARINLKLLPDRRHIHNHFDWFLDNGANLNTVCFDTNLGAGRLPLQIISEWPSRTAMYMEKLIKKGACINCPLTPLHKIKRWQAAWYGNKVAVELLLDYGADIDYRGGFIALNPGLKSGGPRNVFVCDGTALELARRRGHTRIVDILERTLSGSQREINTPKEPNASSEDDIGLGWDICSKNPSPSPSSAGDGFKDGPGFGLMAEVQS